jgi:hypothetical protein
MPKLRSTWADTSLVTNWRPKGEPTELQFSHTLQYGSAPSSHARSQYNPLFSDINPSLRTLVFR